VRTWRQVASFDHSKTRFALTGAHRGAACEECHRSTALSVGAHKVVFQGAPLACVGCHEDVHAGQFAAMSESQGCESCHDNITWKAGKFDHQRTSFPLDGAHRTGALQGLSQHEEGSQRARGGVLQANPERLRELPWTEAQKLSGGCCWLC
jgi:hypothetical protein